MLPRLTLQVVAILGLLTDHAGRLLRVLTDILNTGIGGAGVAVLAIAGGVRGSTVIAGSIGAYITSAGVLGGPVVYVDEAIESTNVLDPQSLAVVARVF